MTKTLTPLPPEPISANEFDELDAILDELRTRCDETPQWEFCEGFMAAAICGRRDVGPDEAMAVLLDIGDTADGEGEGSFVDEAQAQRFTELWLRRWNQVVSALSESVESLDDERAYYPEVMDVRGALAALSEADRAQAQAAAGGSETDVPAFAQVWAIGFMFAVETWPQDWAAPRDKEAAKWLDEGLQAIVAMTEDDTDPPTISIMDDDTPPSVSESRFHAFADAVWAVYDLREMWRNVGPRVATVRKTAAPGRNDLCHCGSGKKYKKCHGAN